MVVVQNTTGVRLVNNAEVDPNWEDALVKVLEAEDELVAQNKTGF